MKTSGKKRIRWVWPVVVLAVAAVLEPVVGLSQEAKKPRYVWNKYALIFDRNMFSRQRGVQRREEGPVREVAVPNPESYFLLKGVVQEDGKFIAFLEDTRGGTVLKLCQGDSVARGTIKTLTLDGIEYQFGDQVIAIPLGKDLEGGQGAVTMNELMQFSETAPGAPTEASAPPAETPTGEAADILKRLMERRKQELGQ